MWSKNVPVNESNAMNNLGQALCKGTPTHNKLEQPSTQCTLCYLPVAHSGHLYSGGFTIHIFLFDDDIVTIP